MIWSPTQGVVRFAHLPWAGRKPSFVGFDWAFSPSHPRSVRLRCGGSRRHLRGRTALQADTKGVADIRGRFPRLLTVQPSRLDSLACLILPLRNHPCKCSPGTVQPSRLDSLACLILPLSNHTCKCSPRHSTAFQAKFLPPSLSLFHSLTFSPLVS